MAVYKRPESDVWQIRFEHLGRTVKRSAKTKNKRLAERYEERLREQLYQEKLLGAKQVSWTEAVDRWYLEKASKKSLRGDRIIERYYTELVTAAGITDLSEVDQDTADELRGWTLKQKRAPNTVNRYLAWLRAFLNAAKRWRMLAVAPMVPAVSVPKRLPPRVTRETLDSVFKHLPAHDVPPARFALATGFRRANVLRLEWERVNLEQRTAFIPSSQHKSGHDHVAPLNDDAIAILEAQKGKHPQYVFTDHKGRAPIGSVKTAWRRATRLGGVPWLRFHDLRHAWASWHTMNGTPALVLKELAGWQSLAMTEVYSHLAPSHLQGWAGNVSKGQPPPPTVDPLAPAVIPDNRGAA